MLKDMCRVSIAALSMAIWLGSFGAAHARVSLPWVLQKTPTDCGRAVLASLASRNGGNIEDIYRRIPDPLDAARGYSVSEIMGLSRTHGMSMSLLAPKGAWTAGRCTKSIELNAYLSRISQKVAAGLPVIVPIANDQTAGHYLILVGFEDGRFTVHDPAKPELRQIVSDELADLMCHFAYLGLEVRWITPLRSKGR